MWLFTQENDTGPEIDPALKEELFHNSVRELIITLLLGITLYVSAYVTIHKYKRRPDRDDFYSGDDGDRTVYRVAVWICSFTLAVSYGAVLLLPISIVSNEVLLLYPNSYYLKWLNNSLIHGLWNTISLLSNVALFIGMPFAYFFLESEGFIGSRKGIMGRVYESFLLMFLLGVLVCGLTFIAAAILNADAASKQTLFNVWEFYLPFVYSVISLMGVCLLLICTPVGFTVLFSVLGRLVVKPQFWQNVGEELDVKRLEEANLRRKLQHGVNSLANGLALSTPEAVEEQLLKVTQERRDLERRKRASAWQRNLGYPVLFVLLGALTAISVLFVAHHSLELLLDEQALHVTSQEVLLGNTSLSVLGIVGASVEILLILYLMLASVVGLYCLPGLGRLRPVAGDTSLTQVLLNCCLMLVLSSALPVLARTLGITKFDLLGDFGQIDWLQNFYIILTYNLVFGATSTLCLVTKFTSSVRQEILNRLSQAFTPAPRSRLDNRTAMAQVASLDQLQVSEPPPHASSRDHVREEEDEDIHELSLSQATLDDLNITGVHFDLSLVGDRDPELVGEGNELANHKVSHKTVGNGDSASSSNRETFLADPVGVEDGATVDAVTLSRLPVVASSCGVRLRNLARTGTVVPPGAPVAAGGESHLHAE